MTICTICCQCGRWYGPWYDEAHNCLGQWEVDPETNRWFYNSCNHLRCGGCGKGDFPLPCEGEKKVIRAPGENGAPKKFNRKKKKGQNRNRSSKR